MYGKRLELSYLFWYEVGFMLKFKSIYDAFSSVKVLFFPPYLFILGESTAGEGQIEGDRGSEAGSVLTVVNPMWGLNSQNVRS